VGVPRQSHFVCQLEISSFGLHGAMLLLCKLQRHYMKLTKHSRKSTTLAQTPKQHEIRLNYLIFTYKRSLQIYIVQEMRTSDQYKLLVLLFTSKHQELQKKLSK